MNKIKMATVKEVYTILEDKIKSKEYSLDPIICNKITRLPKEYGNFLLGILYEYYTITTRLQRVSELDLITTNKRNGILTLPYKGRTHENGKGPQYEVKNLPPRLAQLISAFIEYIEAH